MFTSGNGFDHKMYDLWYLICNHGGRFCLKTLHIVEREDCISQIFNRVSVYNTNEERVLIKLVTQVKLFSMQYYK